MKKETLAITSLHIRRMPGFRNGMKPLGPFSPRITLVYGPNASGKSTTARAIQSLFWPSLDAADEISAQFSLSEQHWAAEVIGKHVTAFADGQPQTLPIHESPESSRRYMLALHDLIKDSDAHMADAVRKEAAGGYDLSAAVHTLRYRDSYTRANAADVVAFREAKEKAAQIKSEQEELQHRYSRLDELRDKREQAQKDTERKQLFEQLLELRKHEEELQQAIEQRDAFPKGIERVRTGDLDLFKSLKEELGKSEEDLARTRAKAQQTLRELRALKLPVLNEGLAGMDGATDQAGIDGATDQAGMDGATDQAGVDGATDQAGVSATDLEELQELAASWREYERDAADIDRNIDNKRKVREECEHRLAPRINKEQLATLAPESQERLARMQSTQIGELAPLLQQAMRSSGRLKTLSDRINEAGDPTQQPSREHTHQAHTAPDDEQIDADRLSRAIGLFSRWLGETHTSARLSSTWYLITALIGAVSALAVYLAGSLGFASLVLLAAWLWYGWRQTHHTAGDTDTAASPSTRQDELNRLGVAGPERWSRDEVLKRLDTLSLALARAHKRKELAQERERLERERLQLIEQLQEQHERVRDAGQQLGFDVHPWKGHGDPELEMAYWVLTHLLRWHEANHELQGLQAHRDRLGEQMTELSQKVNRLAGRYGPALTQGAGSASETHTIHLSDAAQAQAACAVLRDKSEQWKRLSGTHQTLIEGIDELKKRITREGHRFTELLQRLHMNEDEEYRLVEWNRDLKAYADACLHVKTLELTVERMQHDLKTHPLFEQTAAQGPLPDLPRTEIEAAIERLRSSQSTLKDLTEQIIRIKQQADSVREERKLEQALGELDQKRGALFRLYEQNLAELTGDALAGLLSREIYTQGSTPVQKKASELFTRITRGRYRIELSEQEDQGFLAWDTLENRSKSLDALSSGTRIQLLLAVRLAFIEQYEAGIALPLLADELLANSDDERAGEIVDALVAIAGTGRQVIYFTAQADEVAKWLSRLQAAGLNEDDYALLQLSGDASAATFVPPAASGETRPTLAVALPDLSVDVPAPDESQRFSNQAQTAPAAATPAPAQSQRATYLETLAAQHLIPPFTAAHEPIERLPVVHVLDTPDAMYRVLRLGIFRLGMLTHWLEAMPEKTQPEVSDGWIHNQPLLSPDERRSVKRWSTFFAQYLSWRRQGHDRPIDREVLDASGAITSAFKERVNEALSSVEFVPSRLIEALRSGAVPRFQSSRADQLEAYLQENGYIALDEPLTNDELAIRLRNLVMQLELSPDEAQQRIRELE